MEFSNKIDKRRIQYVIKFDSLVDDIQIIVAAGNPIIYGENDYVLK